MILTGIGDEAGNQLASQLAATRDLDWRWIEARNIEVPGHPKANLHDLADPAFDLALRQLEEAGIGVYCLGSTILNWSRRVTDPFEPTVAEVRRALPRMQRLRTRFVRIMSCKPGDDEYRIPTEVFRRVRDVTQMFLDAGLQPVHENCMNYGGMSSQHALELLDRVPGLKWVFDTANPVFNPDRSKARPWPRQDPWEFWQAVRDHVLHIHIKDARWNDAKNDADYRWPGEGDGRVRDIVRDALSRGYNGAFSIEPHMVAVFHSADSPASNDAALRANYVEYGRRLEAMLKPEPPR
jgi:sugar phosphate isomerase/epimerase